MRDPSQPGHSRRLTRRDALKGAAALGATGLLACRTDEELASPGPGPSGGRRAAIIGGGAGGIASAYFLEGEWAVDLFEARSKVGGHCDSESIEYQGQTISVDLGAQFFHPDTHPIYTTLLEELGLYDPDHPDADETIEAPGGICIFPSGGGSPEFSSVDPGSAILNGIDFAIFAQNARGAVLGEISWEVTLEAWIEGLPLRDAFKASILGPWTASLIGSARASAARSSARSILQTFALAFPSNLFAGATTFNSRLGLGGNLLRILERCPSARVHLDSPVERLSFAGGAWTVATPAGEHGPFDAVIVNAPPRVSRALVAPLEWASDITALLGEYEYFDSRLIIHTDAAYVHPDRRQWAAYNAAVDGLECEGSVWLGGIHEKLPGGGTVDVFKSWAERRRADPANILFERRFQHVLLTPEVIGAARALRASQGRNGLYFAGAQTTGMDLQESAIYSAMKIADLVAPDSAPLALLRARLLRRGRRDVAYDL